MHTHPAAGKSRQRVPQLLYISCFDSDRVVVDGRAFHSRVSVILSDIFAFTIFFTCFKAYCLRLHLIVLGYTSLSWATPHMHKQSYTSKCEVVCCVEGVRGMGGGG